MGRSWTCTYLLMAVMLVCLVLHTAGKSNTLCRRQPRACTSEEFKVCGSDGETYNSPCKLDEATACNSELKKIHDGECKNKENPDRNEEVPDRKKLKNDVPK